MAEPITIPDFGSDRNASAKRSQYIIEHATGFTAVCRKGRLKLREQCETLFDARGKARFIYTLTKHPVMIYAVYGPYDTWVETYDGTRNKSEKGEG